MFHLMGFQAVRRLVLIAPVLVFATGCSEKALPTSPVHPVSGTVTYKGGAVEGATVVFLPQTGGTPATGLTDAAGNFRLTTYKDGDGAVAGRHSVSVAKMESTPATGDTSMEAAAARKPEKPAASKALIPAVYANSQKSGLEETVKEGGPNEFKIELKD